ncbi:dihydropteroate synthase [Aquabacterium sp.]|uniref:dihydropteroate synthase n=1 Tax=Aquabacterium sp. TaxID=1872578 RepID=UPI002618E673|nr:dihydropteroate synthase [Aquabacterium sp.]MDD2975490.1 dihydropteroate synthase [Aquabacterium sp.]
MFTWHTTRFQIDLSRPQVMGIVNVTPDSFSDGGQHADTRQALAHCEQLIKDGADILDLGGESTRPGAPTLTVEAEWARLEGVIRGALSLGVPLSIDTCKAEVMRRALDLGADIINDIRGLEDEGAVDVVARHGACGVCLMHMQGDPATMQLRPTYPDVVDEVKGYLSQRAEVVRAAGVAQARITLDPGIGFGKTPEHNFRLLREQASLLEMGYPLLIGWSRKSSLGALTGRPVGERLAASLSAALAGVQRGAHIVRVHDVAETVDALKVWAAAGLPDPLA